jgi:hypothetical protein
VAFGKVKLFAWRGFCYPSLDDEPVSGRLPAEYPRVTPGKHQVFCSPDRAGPRLPVGEIVVEPGSSIEKHIKPGADRSPRF